MKSLTSNHNKENPMKKNQQLCQCGCGMPVSKMKIFIHGHHARLQPKGKKSHRWNGGISVDKNGRKYIYMPNHKSSNSWGYIYEYILIIEKVLGKILPNKVVVHHVDVNPANNKNSNLVVCEDQDYHMLLHQRQRAYDICGNANWKKCKYCKQYDDSKNLYKHPSQNSYFHRKCSNENRMKNRKKGR